MRCLSLALLSLCGCLVEEAADPVARPPLGTFPNAGLVADGHLALPSDLPSAATPIDVARLAHRTGFSPVQTVVIREFGWLDATTLPAWDAPTTDGSVQIWDLTDGVAIPCFAELDAYPNLQAESPALLVRPARPVPSGHEAAVVVLDSARTLDGPALTRPAWYAAALAGDEVTGTDAAAEANLATRLADLAGVSVDRIVLSASWPVDDGTAPLRSMLADLRPASVVDISVLREAGIAPDLPPHTWKQLVGSYSTDDWLVDPGGSIDDAFELDSDGLPVLQGTTESHLFIHIPASVEHAADGTVPVWIFGHGIFAAPEVYFEDLADSDGVLALADAAGAVIVATRWRGLTTTDIAVPTNVAGDIATFPKLTDKLAQGVANTVALVKLARSGALFEHAALADVADKVDPSTLRYFGISLGGIEGAVAVATTPEIPHAVLHVGGSTWSTMLERSKHWSLFETILTGTLPSPGDRQLLYSLSQLWWDPVDPANYADDLADRSVLWQIARGDDQVPNLSSWVVARGAGAALLEPYPAAVVGLTAASSPTTGPAVALFDPEAGDHEGTNRPSPSTGAHDLPRLWPGAQRQILRFLDVNEPGVVAHFCGEVPCSLTNPGAAEAGP